LFWCFRFFIFWNIGGDKIYYEFGSIRIFGNIVSAIFIRLGTIILFIDVILEVGRAINIYATNALRATGDVNYPFYVGFVVQWSVAVGCGFLFGIHWGWGLVGMWCAFVLDENLRGIIFVQRWNSLKWTKKGFVK
jgi:Na+-driven multidrug efflux pump